MSKLSIIIPIYKAEKYLRRCLDSIISQTLDEIEIILATDGPEDCNIICEEYKQKDSRIKILYNPGSYGKAFNKALAMANGEYIGIVETDDWCDKTMFEKLYKKAKENDSDVVKCEFYFAYDEKHKNTVSLLPKHYPEDFSVFNYPEFLESQPSVWSCIYKKNFLINNNIRMMEEHQAFIDVPFHQETSYKATKYTLLKEPLYYYYQDNANQSVKNVESTSGLNSEKQAYQLISQDKFIYNELSEGFIFATTQHLLWNYERLKTDEQRNSFWLEAHNYLNSIDLTGVQYIYLNSQLKQFFQHLKCRRQKPDNYEPKNSDCYIVRLFNIIPILTLAIKPNKLKIKLFGIIPLLYVKLHMKYTQKYKLLGLLNIITVNPKQKKDN